MKKVLVIDDSKTIRTLCELIHKGLDTQVFTASGVVEAETIIQSQSPNVIFVDYTLKDGDAYEFISSHAKAGCGIVMMGGNYADFNRDRAISAGAVDVIVKPFKTDAYFAAEDKAYAFANGEDVASVSAPAVDAMAASAPAVDSGVFAPPSTGSGIFSNPTTGSGIQSVPRIGGVPTAGAAMPPIANSAPKRFNFPSATSSTSNSAISANPSQPSNPAIERPSHISGVVLRPTDSATPKTPIPAESPSNNGMGEVRSTMSAADTEAIRAEVLAVVKQLLPAAINAYVKKAIQAEIKPQLQTWVDARVEAVVRQLLQR